MPTDTDEERAAAPQIATFQQSGNGYYIEMATRPQTIGYALLDSPVALAVRSPGHAIEERTRMGVAERRLLEGQIEENERLLDEVRQDRVRHEAIVRRAERRIQAGFAPLRRGTLRLVPKQ